MLENETCEPCRGGVPPLNAPEAQALLPDVPGWVLDNDAKKLKKHFSFDNFQSALDFTVKLGALAEKHWHHPDITLGWGYCDVTFYTHKINGLHKNDFILAAKTNALVE